jgi:chromosome segregation ATPase
VRDFSQEDDVQEMDSANHVLQECRVNMLQFSDKEGEIDRTADKCKKKHAKINKQHIEHLKARQGSFERIVTIVNVQAIDTKEKRLQQLKMELIKLRDELRSMETKRQQLTTAQAKIREDKQRQDVRCYFSFTDIIKHFLCTG